MIMIVVRGLILCLKEFLLWINKISIFRNKKQEEKAMEVKRVNFIFII